jgi:A/G-specific adenine glycosylase
VNPQALLEWFDTVRRDLPWRRRRDPWAVLVSEVMLQQTQVDRVLAYFEPFMERFPGVEDCAGADIDEVLAHWTGLGYYRRARALHAAARVLVATGAPQRWPGSAREWRQLPGIGAYSAAALASSCCGEVVAAIDGNVERVVGRWLGLQGVYGAPARSEIKRRAESVLDASRPGDSNQALIELGALVCRPRAPSCSTCPVAGSCGAARSGEPALFGPRRAVRASIEVALTVVWVERDGRVLLIRRAEEGGLLDRLWELPWCELGKPEGLDRRYGTPFAVGRSIGRCSHTITFRRISAALVEGECAGTPEGGVWFPIEELPQVATSSLVLKLRRLVLARRRPVPVIGSSSRGPR